MYDERYYELNVRINKEILDLVNKGSEEDILEIVCSVAEKFNLDIESMQLHLSPKVVGIITKIASRNNLLKSSKGINEIEEIDLGDLL